MIDKKKVIAIIPARGGSKGLPGKNILKILGHPLISYSIKAGFSSNYVDRVIVSTDSEEIAGISKEYSAEVPFIRPSEIAQDLSTDFEVFTHAVEWLKLNEKYQPDFILHLRPTSPVRFKKDLDNCIEFINSSDADSVRSVTPSPITPYKMWVIDNEKEPMKPLLEYNAVKEPFNQPRQNLPKVYWQTGTIDILKIETLVEKKSMTGRKILPYIIENKFSVDIDTIVDFINAEKVISETDCIKFYD